MALSFADSLKMQKNQIKKSTLKAEAVSAYTTLSEDNIAPMAISAESEITEWTRSENYLWYEEYHDENYSTVDENKNITINPKQINLTQESNSQYIPFKMPRYYDGVDLMTKTFLVVFENKNGQGAPETPVNVEYNDSSIRFGLLASKNFTAVEGEVKIEIQAIGTTSKGNEYVWKTRSGSLNIEKSLSGNGLIEPDETWITSFLTQATEKVAEAQTAAQEAQEAAKNAEASAQLALQAAADSQVSIEDAKTELSNTVEATVTEKLTIVLADYYTSEEVDKIIENIDISDQLTELEEKIDSIDGLAAFNVDYAEDTKTITFYNGETVIKSFSINTDPSAEWTSTYNNVVDNKISTATSAVSSALEEYKTKTDADLSSIHDNIDNLPETLKTDYYDKEATDALLKAKAESSDVVSLTNKVNAVEQTANTNKTSITAISAKVVSLEEALKSIDTEPGCTYEITKDEESGMYILWEIRNEGLENETRIEKSRFAAGGGSGGGTSSTLKIEYVTKSPITVTTNDNAIIKYKFSGLDSSGDEVTEGTYTWKMNNKVIATGTATSGENTFDATDFISIGTQKLVLSIQDSAGSLVTKTWSVQKVDVRIASDFNDKVTYPLGDVSFDYTPYGAIAKTVHIKLDDVEIGTVNTSSSGLPMAYTLPSQAHGAHLVEAYITAEINNSTIETNHVYKDVIWYDSNSDVPVIGCVSKNLTIKQYDTANIVYTVFDPNTETPTVVLAIDGKDVSTLTLDESTKTWQYKTSEVGSHTLTITCGETVKTISVEVEELDIDVTPITAGLEFDFNPTGYSNNDANRLWKDENKEVAMTVSDNFDWQNGGYQIDDNGDQYFCVKAGTTATINYKLFADDPKKTGKEFKVIFKTTNVKNRNSSFITCMNNNIGLDMKIESANIYSSNDSLYSPYCEDDIIEFEFNINKNTDIPMVLTYEDGVANRPMIYTSDASFMQTIPQLITIGSENCDVHIYRMKAYSSSLSNSNILSNFIADARNAEEMIDRYNRNQIYDENGLLDPYVLAEKCPDLRIILVDCPRFTTDKSDKVSGTNITMIYKNGDPILDNWTCTGGQHSGQGTSSNEYGYSGRNMDLIMDGDEIIITLGDGETNTKAVSLTRNSTPTDYFNIKVNIASSENENNAQMTMRFNQYQPYTRPARLIDSKKRDCMEFYNCIVFVREYNEDLSTHNEFSDTSYHYYALGNIGDSKHTDDTRVFDKDDPKTCCIEVMDYNVALAEFPTGYADEAGKEAICPENEWKEGNAAYDYLYADYKYKDGKFKSFGSESYEFRYEKDGITTEEREANINAWREAYKFVVTSDDEKFKNDFSKYFIKDSILYFYLFTERYLLIDNRAKNCFFLREKAYFSKSEAEQFKTQYNVEIQEEYINDEQAAINDGYRWNLNFGYDFDTCLGIDNTGKLVLTYGQEDIDYYTDGDPSSGYIYRAAESNFFCRVRDLFKSELEAMFVDRESAGAWSASGLINQWDNAQAQFPEEIWRLDTQRKYLRTYQGISIDNSIVPSNGAVAERFLKTMLNGRKKYQRRMFERNQELYMATKYFGNTATQDQIMMRFNNPVGATVKPDFTLYITPYSDMYIGVKFGNFTPVNFRAKAGKEYTVPYTLDAADITLIFGASFIQAIGDLSKCYVGDNDFSKATRLQSLSVGSELEGYSNGFMTSIGLGSNKLLEYLDVRKITGLNSVIDLSQCNNLLELHAEGSGATGIIFSNGGKVQKAYLPSVISMTVKNLNNLEEFEVESYDNLQTLIVENTPFLDTYEMVDSAINLKTLRLVGINWDENYHFENSEILDRLLTLRGIGSDGYETQISSVSGAFYSAIMKQKDLENYQDAWKNLEISYGTLIEQFKVEFVNDDGTVLDVQYVDKGGMAVDPITRADNPIATPTKESSVSTDYTYKGWDASFVTVFTDQKYTATYSESTREYTVRHLSKGVVKQTKTALYGTYVDYEGDIPTYTTEETAYKYSLFKDWDKSGYVDGDKDINAVFDTCEYVAGYFDNIELSEMRPVEIYAMCKLGLEQTVITDKDPYSFKMGYDVEYSDVDSVEIISEKKQFNGADYYDSKVSLFDEDRDFTLAIDYEFLTGTSTRGVLAQCFQSNGSNGFKLWYNSGAKLTWGTSTSDAATINNREMIVIRHIKGDNNLYVYNSALEGSVVVSDVLQRTKDTIASSTLVFGASKADDGMFENYAVGNINWCKLWYADLGDATCKKLALWTHEEITLEACGFRKYYLSENASKRCSFSLLATHLLDRARPFSNVQNNSGGWEKSTLRTFLNGRFYEAMPTDMKSLVKQVKVPSSIGNKSTEVTTCDSYITVPAYIEVDPTIDTEPYLYEGTSISYIHSNETRVRSYNGGNAATYWLRSPNVGYINYIYTVDSGGKLYGYNYPTTEAGICIELSI